MSRGRLTAGGRKALLDTRRAHPLSSHPPGPPLNRAQSLLSGEYQASPEISDLVRLGAQFGSLEEPL